MHILKWQIFFEASESQVIISCTLFIKWCLTSSSILWIGTGLVTKEKGCSFWLLGFWCSDAGAYPGLTSVLICICVSLILFSFTFSQFLCFTPNASWFPLHSRSLVHLDLPSPNHMCPWSLLRLSLHFLLKAVSGHILTPLPGRKAARRRGDRYQNGVWDLAAESILCYFHQAMRPERGWAREPYV